ncbi:MAG TPA: UDP-glucose/GDP-mannose dehydrogenase family protein [Aeromicrobium sp.]|nr:UDP-glucose/GDP-mannose dehydrogenase family protein [Aeromicrobium sp.]
MRISVIGCGYLGAVHAACMASLGHDVIGIEPNAARIDALSAGRAPFFEPNLPDLLSQGTTSGHLSFDRDIAAARGAQVHFICVGTPQSDDSGAADLSQVDSAFEELLPYLSDGDIVVGKSTVPVGTAERLAAMLHEHNPRATLLWNPEFLREGYAVEDTLHPDRVVLGAPDGAESAIGILTELYAGPLADGTPLIVTDYATSQLVKVAANSFLATKISFINAMAELCERAGGDVAQLADAIGYDARIGRRFLNAGIGFGGGCLPKDIRAFMARAGELGADQTLEFLREVDAINLNLRDKMVELGRDLVGGSLDGVTIAVLGASFKPNSDDVRDSPALDIAARLHAAGARVVVTDPEAIENARTLHPELSFAASVKESVAGADLVMLLTEWDSFVALDPVELARLVAKPVILDGRNALDAGQWRGAGWTYRALGRR